MYTSEMKKNNIEPKRIQFVYPSINSEANILLIEGTKNGNPGVKILPPLISHKQNGEYTEQVNQFFEKRSSKCHKKVIIIHQHYI